MGTILALALTGVLGWDSLPQEAPRLAIALAPIVNTCDPKFPHADKEFVRAEMDGWIEKLLSKSAESSGYRLVGREKTGPAAKDLGIDFANGRHRNLAQLTSLGTQVEVQFVILILVGKDSQKNAEVSSILSNPGRPLSESKVEVRTWVASVPDAKWLADGSKRAITGLAQGPYFGTTRSGEITGNPDDIAQMTLLESKRRAEWLGRAAFSGAMQVLSNTLGFKQPEPPSR